MAAAMAAATVSSFSFMTVSAANTVYESGNNWVGSDYVDEDNPGTAITTKKTITVTDVRDQKNGAETAPSDIDVVAYQLVKGTYKDGRLTGYVLCDETTAIQNLQEPTADEITAVASAVRKGDTSLNGIYMTRGENAQSNTYTADVEAGLYIVLASGANGYVYNPAVVAVNINDANSIADSAEGGTVSFASYWAYPAKAYLKSATTNFNKDILGSTASPYVVSETSDGDIVSKGANVFFQLDGMIIPSYSDEYAKPDGDEEEGIIYKVDDVLDGVAFAGISNLAVKTNTGVTKDDDNDPETPEVLEETEVLPVESVDDDNDPETPNVQVTNFTVIYKNAAGEEVTGDDIIKSAVSYEVRFSDAWVRANSEKNVVITYESVLTENANVNGTANKTVATLTYTVDPADNKGVEVLRDSTYHYTFEIGGQIDATANGEDAGTVDGVRTFHGYEINKVTEALAADKKYEADAENGEYSSQFALGGATFTLYDDKDFTKIHQMKVRNDETGEWETADATCVTADDGHLVFSGLDTGEYYLKETVAPDDYTLNANNYKIVVDGTVADGTGDSVKGTLTGYSIEVYVKDGENWTSVGSSFYTITPAVAKPAADADALSFDTVVNTITTNIAPAEIIDTKIAELPSTGGMGTIILTVVSAMGMALFLTVYLANRRKKEQDED